MYIAEVDDMEAKKRQAIAESAQAMGVVQLKSK